MEELVRYAQRLVASPDISIASSSSNNSGGFGNTNLKEANSAAFGIDSAMKSTAPSVLLPEEVQRQLLLARGARACTPTASFGPQRASGGGKSGGGCGSDSDATRVRRRPYTARDLRLCLEKVSGCSFVHNCFFVVVVVAR